MINFIFPPDFGGILYDYKPVENINQIVYNTHCIGVFPMRGVITTERHPIVDEIPILWGLEGREYIE